MPEECGYCGKKVKRKKIVGILKVAEEKSRIKSQSRVQIC
jgi:hypothetical protein